ncbi:P-loop containing nucleoside triphosphate hydrolase protein [Neohortaea acidophila]|uniref:P-loop containing nucleoside triphosphate hydrolase protein n=1 Tax=Neohortaea acidophila TaxID=245834 RepID=A0A6A6PIR4_9PEZI|nr:P-loop containing nucleoside triphosphate hydrolase protein [Neohortaea acidophila]KAF2479882.1 P-loop containing nucleoside triphosphate hydrolase protein [Neohortaea acidophila]
MEPLSPQIKAEMDDAIKQELPADAKNVTTTSLGSLQNKDSRQVMDIVDRLRRSGLSGELQLPQLVVCGDQSSGKSSVLEAITEIPFPRKENLCTRFATEIILRRATSPSISTKIIPDKFRAATEKTRLEGFKASIVDFSELPNLIDEATKLMEAGRDEGSGQRAFFRDVLSIEIAGPGRPHLTLVDLPGLIHTDTQYQSKEDVELIHGLVQDYISEKRTIMLAVVSAKNDYANQVILKKCRDVDPKGLRTLGIITKPDYLEAGSAGEQAFIDLANNRDVTLSLGWHMLKNRSAKEINNTFGERNASEAAFLSKGSYRDLPADSLGIEALRTRLSHLLYKHLKTELPALQKELNEKLIEVTHGLELLGDKRSTPQEQRRFLMTVGTNYQDIVNAAVKGHYEDTFFGSLAPNESVDHEKNMRRLRAVVQYLNQQFAQVMREYGQASKITLKANFLRSLAFFDEEVPKPSTLDDGYAEFAQYQEEITCADAIQRVSSILVRSRGRELPCTFNPLLISQLFWEESRNWKLIAEYHIDRVAEICSAFVRTAIAFTVSPDVGDNLLSLKVDTALQTRLSAAKKELTNIINDTKRHPITYDPAYVDTVQQRRNDVYAARMKQLADEFETTSFTAREKGACLQSNVINADALKAALAERRNLDMEKASAEEALDDSLAYYEEEVKYFIAAVTKQVIERYLLTDLAADTISPIIVGEMSDDEVGFVAAEPEETTRQRQSLEARKATLEKGRQTFKSALGLMGRAGVR